MFQLHRGRKVLGPACAAIALACLLVPSKALAQGSVDAFGGLSLNGITTFGDTSRPVDFGGRVAIDLTPGVQAIGEVGRIGNIMPTSEAILLSFTPIDLTVPAFYGEAGVRLFASPYGVVSPYVEATAGVARLGFNIGGLNPIASTATRAALSFIDRTDPIAGGGGGVMVRGGHVVLDLGYRYKRVFADSLAGLIASGGQRLQVHQVRIGVGVRF